MSIFDRLNLSPKFIPVRVVLADGSIVDGRGADAGMGWCDTVTPLGKDGYVRSWNKTNSLTDPPFVMTRLEEPFHVYEKRAEAEMREHEETKGTTT